MERVGVNGVDDVSNLFDPNSNFPNSNLADPNFPNPLIPISLANPNPSDTATPTLQPLDRNFSNPFNPNSPYSFDLPDRNPLTSTFLNPTGTLPTPLQPLLTPIGSLNAELGSKRLLRISQFRVSPAITSSSCKPYRCRNRKMSEETSGITLPISLPICGAAHQTGCGSICIDEKE